MAQLRRLLPGRLFANGNIVSGTLVSRFTFTS